MDKRKSLIIISALCILGISAYCIINNGKTSNTADYTNKSKVEQNESNVTKNKIAVKNNDVKQTKKSDKKSDNKQVTEQKNENNNENIVKANLYNDAPSSVIPLSAITELTSLPKTTQTLINDIIKSNNIYMIQKLNNKLLIISDNPENIRHSIEFTEISLSNGHQIKTTLGYNDKIKDSQNDIWEYDETTHQPIRHTKYNSDGDMEFVEVWNYDQNDPVKYEMKDANGKVISMRKETLNGGTDLRIEHLLYDKDGNTRINVSATYDGEDIKRFTYYNADKINESGSIFSEYSDGQKIKETVYTSDLKVKNTYTSDYKDGNREDIILWDNQNNEIKKYIPEEL